jgi:hypothetical protein
MPPEDYVSKAETSLQQQADVQSQAAQHLAALQAWGEQAKGGIRQDLQNRWKSWQDEGDKLKGQIANATINPDNYWQSKSTGQRIGVGIGMLLGGIGSGLTGQPNQDAKFVQDAINRDVDAQKANLGKIESSFSRHLSEGASIMDAHHLALADANDALAGQIKLEEFKTADPMAQARLGQARSQIEQAAQEARSTVALRWAQTKATEVDTRMKMMQMGLIGPQFQVQGALTRGESISPDAATLLSYTNKEMYQNLVPDGRGGFILAAPGGREKIAAANAQNAQVQNLLRHPATSKWAMGLVTPAADEARDWQDRMALALMNTGRFQNAKKDEIKKLLPDYTNPKEVISGEAERKRRAFSSLFNADVAATVGANTYHQ